MPARILDYGAAEHLLRLPPEDGPQPAKPPQDEAEANLREVLAFLRMRTGNDFAYYKRATILQRIARRMQVNRVGTLPEYLLTLRTHAGEVRALLQDLLISVTNFFRDRETFAAVRARIEFGTGDCQGDGGRARGHLECERSGLGHGATFTVSLMLMAVSGDQAKTTV